MGRKKKERKKEKGITVCPGRGVGGKGSHHHSVGTPAPIVPNCEAQTPPVPREPPLVVSPWLGSGVCRAQTSAPKRDVGSGQG